MNSATNPNKRSPHHPPKERAISLSLSLSSISYHSHHVILEEIEVWTGGFFILFISVAVFVMLNLVTAVIVENAFSDSKSEEKELAVRLEREKEEELEDLKQFFLQLDPRGGLNLVHFFHPRSCVGCGFLSGLAAGSEVHVFWVGQLYNCSFFHAALFGSGALIRGSKVVREGPCVIRHFGRSCRHSVTL